MININPLTVGDQGTFIKGIMTGRLSFFTSNIGGNGVLTLTATLPGATVGDIFVPMVISGFTGSVRLESLYPSSTNTVTAVFANGDATTTLAGGSPVVVQYLWFDLT